MLKIIQGLLAGLLARCAPAEHPQLSISRFGRLAQWFVEASLPPGGLPAFESKHSTAAQLFLRVSQLIYEREPQRSTAVLALGDAFFENRQYREAIVCYLRHQFRYATLGVNQTEAARYLRRLTVALLRIKATAEAIALSQLQTPVDYARLIPVLHEEQASLNEAYFALIWDEPYLEVLIHLYSRRSTSTVSTFMKTLQNPRCRHPTNAMWQSLKEKIFQELFSQFLGQRFMLD
jgi:hypothetical protein